MQYQVGEKVIYPGRGICEIQRVFSQKIDGKDVEFYYLMFLRDDATVMVPVKKAHAIGIRRLLNKSEVSRVYTFLERDIKAPSRDYKVRYQKNVDRLASGTIFDIADVVKSLAYLSTIKKLSDRETDMLDRARALLIHEIAQASGIDAEKVEDKVDSALSQFQVQD